MVEAAGVEPEIIIENTQLIDSANASIAVNPMISKSAVRSLYKIDRNSQNVHPRISPLVWRAL